MILVYYYKFMYNIQVHQYGWHFDFQLCFNIHSKIFISFIQQIYCIIQEVH